MNTVITINGKNVSAKLHKDDNAALAQALTTKNPDSAAWRNLANNAKVTGILSVLDSSFEVSVIVDEKPRTDGATIGRINARLAVVRDFASWGWNVLTDKGAKVTEESMTDESEVLALFA